MKFDIRPSGVHGVRAKASGRGADLSAKSKALRKGADGVAKACGHADLAAAFEAFADYVDDASRPMVGRVARGVAGAGKASGAYEDGDTEMARDSAWAMRASGAGANRLMGGV